MKYELINKLQLLYKYNDIKGIKHLKLIYENNSKDSAINLVQNIT